MVVVVVMVIVTLIAMEMALMVMVTTRGFRLGGGRSHPEMFDEN
jgi:hypothetical protein